MVGPAAAELLVTVGEVSDRAAVVWARAPASGRVTVEVGRAGQPGARRRLTAEAAPESDFTVKLRVETLAPPTRDELRILREEIDPARAIIGRTAN